MYEGYKYDNITLNEIYISTYIYIIKYINIFVMDYIVNKKNKKYIYIHIELRNL